MDRHNNGVEGRRMTTPIYRLLPIVATWWALSEVVSTSSYDEYMTCGEGGGRYGRQYHQRSEMPCDLSKETFCITPGNHYPWSSVRRFVFENQGLMKRMYGNQRHYNVLRAELLHELREEMFDEMPVRQRHRFYPPSQSASLSSRTARYQTHSNANSLQMERLAKSERKETDDEARDHSRAFKIITAESPAHLGQRRRQQVSSSSSYSTSTRSSSSSSTMSKTRLKKPENRVKPVALPSNKDTPALPTDETSTTVTGQATRINTRRPQTTPLTNFPSDPTTFTTDGEITTTYGTDGSFLREANGETTTSNEGLHLAEEYEDEPGAFEPTYFPPHLLDDLDLFEDEDLWTTLEDLPLGTYSTPPTYSSEFSESTLSTLGQDMFTLTPGTTEDISDDVPGYGSDEVYPQSFASTVPDRDGPTTIGGPPKVLDEAATEAYVQERSDLNPGFKDSVAKNGNSMKQERPLEVAVPPSEAPVRDLQAEKRVTVPVANGVVHKDVLEDVKEEDPPAEPVITKKPLPGVNACPVKEEFVAPYWANNTRGQTLALLNLYPFEQYIQWERCLYEHRQMYCRKGCRCEQQYRLHKLLAFDPNNHCRGIFSDWFRLPSCCVCKCYDLPQELFSARSPRHQFEQTDQYEDDYPEDEEEDEDYKTDDEGGFANRGLEENVGNDDNDDDDETEEDGDEDQVRQRYLVRSGGRLVNIPPQRRPRQPPRPASHITTLRATSSSPLVVKNGGSESTSRHYEMAADASTSPSPPPMSTLGTLDAATPYYFSNISQHAHILLANSRPFPLSRIPRSKP